MNGNPAVVKLLQAAIPGEAHLNLQYRMNARLLKFEGISKASKTFSKFAGDQHDFLKAVTDQLLFLSDDPASKATAAYQPAGIAEPKSITELLESSLGFENAICAQYEQGIPVATAARDDETRNLFEHLIKWHHDHVRWLEKKLRNIAKYGEDQIVLSGKL